MEKNNFDKEKFLKQFAISLLSVSLGFILISCFNFLMLKNENLTREKEKDCIKYYIDNDGYILQNCNEYIKKLEEFK